MDDKKIDEKVEIALDKLEKPINGDYVAGLRAFIEWTKDLVAKKK